MDYSKLPPDLIAKLQQWESNRPENKQVQVLSDIASMVQELISVADGAKANTDQLKALGAVLDDSRQQLVSLNKKESPKTPDFSAPVVEAVDKLGKELSAQLAKIDVKPQVNLPAPQVQVDAPQVNVSPPSVDLKGIEKILKSDIPKAFSQAISQIPESPEPNQQPVLDSLANIDDLLTSIEKLSRRTPQFPNTLKVTNTDGSTISDLSIFRDYDHVVMSNADGNGNYQTFTYSKNNFTLFTLSYTYDGSNNVTSITRT